MGRIWFVKGARNCYWWSVVYSLPKEKWPRQRRSVEQWRQAKEPTAAEQRYETRNECLLRIRNVTFTCCRVSSSTCTQWPLDLISVNSMYYNFDLLPWSYNQVYHPAQREHYTSRIYDTYRRENNVLAIRYIKYCSPERTYVNIPVKLSGVFFHYY